MPFVRVSLIKGSLGTEQQQDLLEKVVNAVVRVEGESMRSGIGMAIDECSTLIGCHPFVTITLIKAALSIKQLPP